MFVGSFYSENLKVFFTKDNRRGKYQVLCRLLSLYCSRCPTQTCGLKVHLLTQLFYDSLNIGSLFKLFQGLSLSLRDLETDDSLSRIFRSGPDVDTEDDIRECNRIPVGPSLSEPYVNKRFRHPTCGLGSVL